MDFAMSVDKMVTWTEETKDVRIKTTPKSISIAHILLAIESNLNKSTKMA